MAWRDLIKCYEELLGDVYPQPDESGRTEISRHIVNSAPIGEIESVLDVGCGQGYAKDLFPPEVRYVGVTMSHEEKDEAEKLGRYVLVRDFNFLGEEKFDLIFSSHSLEHSPFPVITLMLWRNNSDKLLLIVPNPEHYGYIGKNHYSIAPAPQVRYWLRRAGWKVVWNYESPTDLAFLCDGQERVSSEGWAAELTNEIYEKDKTNTV